MHLLSESEQQVRASLRDAIVLLCQTGLKFTDELSVEGLLAVTLDKKNVFLLSIKETLQRDETVASNDGTDPLCFSSGLESTKFRSVCTAAESSTGIGGQTSNMNEQEDCRQMLVGQLLPTGMFEHGQNEDASTDSESLSQSRRSCRPASKSHRRQRSRYLNTRCPVSSPFSASLSVMEQPENVPGWVGNDVIGCAAGEDECGNHTRDGEYPDTKPGVLPHIFTATMSVDQCGSGSSDQERTETLRSLLMSTEEQKEAKTEAFINNATTENKEAVGPSDQMSKRSYRKRRHAVRRYLDSASPMAASPPSLSLRGQLESVPGWPYNENSNVSTHSEAEAEPTNPVCKEELVDSFSDANRSQDFDLMGTGCLSDTTKTASVEPTTASSDVPSQQLVLPGHSSSLSALPSADQQRQQQLAMMSQFGLSAVVASMQSHFAMLPWPVRAFPALSPPSLPQPNCAAPVDSSSFGRTKGKSKTHRYPKTPLNIPTVNSYRRLNGVKNSPFLSPEVNVCANCGVTRTTVWRRLENKQILCNACGCYFKLHKVHRPLSLVRQEIRSRCRGPKMATLMKASKSRFNSVAAISQPSPPDVALNLTTSPHNDEPK